MKFLSFSKITDEIIELMLEDTKKAYLDLSLNENTETIGELLREHLSKWTEEKLISGAICTIELCKENRKQKNIAPAIHNCLVWIASRKESPLACKCKFVVISLSSPYANCPLLLGSCFRNCAADTINRKAIMPIIL